MYQGFASVYDRFMDNIPYDEWFAYLKGLLCRYGVTDGTVADLGCGTGEISRRLAAAGYDVIGVDCSEEMLTIAMEKEPGVLWLHQDMRRLELYGAVRAMVCICDGMNYMCSEEDLQAVFAGVYSYLEPGGVFVFDMKTEYFYREILGSRTLTDNREDASYIWENEYHEKERLNEYLLTVYELVDDERDLFVRSDELHRQRAYAPERIAELLRQQGFAETEVYRELTEKAPDETTQRVYFLAKKAEQEWR